MKEKIVQKLHNKGYDVEVQTVVKNGVSKCGLMFKTKSNAAPTVYIDNYLNSNYTDGELDGVVNDIIANYKEALKQMPVIDTKKILSWDYAKDNLRLCIQKKGNEEILKEDFLDLELYVKVLVDDTGSYKVRSEHLEYYGVSKETLFETARKCTENTFSCQTMFDMLMSLMPENLADFDFDADKVGAIPMYVITNKDKINGASVMCFEDNLKLIADKLNDDLYILPSSIHEIIVIPAKNNEEESLTEMVRKVNATQVDEEEQLSDHIYYYDRAANKVLLK